MAVRFYGPPLRLAEASSREREASRRVQSVASARIPPRGYLASISLPLPAVAWCENASPGRTGAAASAAAARAVGGGCGGGEVRGGGGQRVFFFPFPCRAGVCKPKPKSVSVGRAHFFCCCPGALRAAWCLRGKSGGSGAGHPGCWRVYCGQAGARRERPGGQWNAGAG